MAEKHQNQRKATRVNVLGHAVIIAPGIRASCIIRDISSTGAKLGVSQKIKLPAGFDLLLTKTETKRRVLLRWRRGDFAGVEFCQRMASTGEPEPDEEKEIWV